MLSELRSGKLYPARGRLSRLAREDYQINPLSDHGDQRDETHRYERPGPAERGDAIGQAIAEGLPFREGTVDVPAGSESAWRRP